MSAMKRHLEDVIYKMHEEGYSVNDIAEYLGVDVEMVEAYIGEEVR